MVVGKGRDAAFTSDLIHLALQILILTLPYKKDEVLVSYIYKTYQKVCLLAT